MDSFSPDYAYWPEFYFHLWCNYTHTPTESTLPLDDMKIFSYSLVCPILSLYLGTCSNAKFSGDFPSKQFKIPISYDLYNYNWTFRNICLPIVIYFISLYSSFMLKYIFVLILNINKLIINHSWTLINDVIILFSVTFTNKKPRALYWILIPHLPVKEINCILLMSTFLI